MESKQEKFQQVIDTAFSLLEQRGIKGVSISLISQRSKISRGWIYKYIASDIDGVLRFCLKAYADEFARFADLKTCVNAEELKVSILSFTSLMVDRVCENQSILSLYFSHIGAKNLVGDIVRETDQRYLQHIANNFELVFKDTKKRAFVKAEVFHSMRMGGLLVFTKPGDKDIAGLKKEYLSHLEILLKSL